MRRGLRRQWRGSQSKRDAHHGRQHRDRADNAGSAVDRRQRLHADLFEMPHRCERARRPAARCRAQHTTRSSAYRASKSPDFLRVNPGNPDESYMVLKIEGAPGIEGGQMPLGETPLPQATIDAIRQWITNGAPNVPAAARRGEGVFAVQDTVPLDRSIVIAPCRESSWRSIKRSTPRSSTIRPSRWNESAMRTSIPRLPRRPRAARGWLSAECAGRPQSRGPVDHAAGRARRRRLSR